MTRSEFRKRFHIPLSQPFNFYLFAIATLLAQLVMAPLGMTSLGGLIIIAILDLFVFLVWAGLRIQFKNRLYDEFSRMVNVTFEDFVNKVHTLMRQ